MTNDGEPQNTGDGAGTGTNPNPTETPNTQNTGEATNNLVPTSLYDKTEAIVSRQEAANKKTEELLGRQETLHANQRLAGTAGGMVKEEPAKEESPKEYNERIDKEISEGKHAD